MQVIISNVFSNILFENDNVYLRNHWTYLLNIPKEFIQNVYRFKHKKIIYRLLVFLAPHKKQKAIDFIFVSQNIQKYN